MAILVQKAKPLPANCGALSNEQTKFLRADPAPHIEFDHIIKARNKREMMRDVLGSIILGVVIFGLPMLGKCVGNS